MASKASAIGYAATFQTFVCFILWIAICFMPYWSKSLNFNIIATTLRPIFDVGLWRICSSAAGGNTRTTGNCVNIDPLNVPSAVTPAFVHVIRAFTIIAIILQFFSFVFSCLSNDCSSVFRGKNRGYVALTSAILNIIANILIIFCVSYWAGKTISDRMAMNGMMSTMFTIRSGNSMTIGTCVILGWCFAPLALILAILRGV